MRSIILILTLLTAVFNYGDPNFLIAPALSDTDNTEPRVELYRGSNKNCSRGIMNVVNVADAFAVNLGAAFGGIIYRFRVAGERDVTDPVRFVLHNRKEYTWLSLCADFFHAKAKRCLRAISIQYLRVIGI